MEIIYKAKDGKTFNSAEECTQYENTLTNTVKEWEAWTWNGRRTDNTNEAKVVKLDTKKAAAQFLAKAKLDGDTCVKGIKKNNTGWFIYDGDAKQYVLIPLYYIFLFKCIFKS